MKHTPLHHRHVEAGAKLVEFAGWKMPLQYEGVLVEHKAVRTACGLFDVSHMGNFAFAGRACRQALGKLLTNDITDLAPGHSRYNLVCNDGGGTLDDVMVSAHAPDYLSMVVNASNRDKLADHFRKRLPEDSWQDDTEAIAMLALQGPASAGILNNLGIRCSTSDGALPPRAQHCEAVVGELALHLHHSGYTGELGFELAIAASHAPELWDLLVENGKLHGLRPAGLGARDTLRLEMGFPLYGHELSEEITPIEAGLGRFVDTGGRDYLGAEALRRQATEGAPRERVALLLEERGVPRHGQRVLQGERTIGVITSGNHSPSLGQGIALALVDRGVVALDDNVAIEIRSRRLKARRVKLPFYRRPSG